MEHIHLPHNHNDNDIWNLERVPSLDQFSIVSSSFKLLDDPVRLRLFWILCHSEECVLNLSALVDMTSPAISHHLTKLKSGGLITSRREGKEVYYKAADTKEVQLLHTMMEQLMQINCPTT